jgi:predicted Zn-dependent protease
VTRRREDWDDDERQALEDLGPEIDRVRARHRGDPPFDLLCAADADALPEPLQEAMAAHLQQSAWSRALVEGAAEADGPLDADGEQRVLARIARSARSTETASRWRMRAWMPALAAAAVLVVMVAVWRQSPVPDSLPPPPEPNATAPAPARTFVLPLDKPDVKLTQAALVLRSAGRDATFVDDIAPALNAYRANDYADADRRFAALETRYPKSVEVVFYRAIARLLQNDASGAATSLQAARRLDDGSFAPEIAWYLATAYERTGDSVRARSELDSLCRQRSSALASRACEAAPRLKPE